MKVTRADLEAKIPRWYRWWLHVTAQVTLWLAILVASIYQLDSVLLVEWWAVPAGLLFFHLYEYIGHRFPLHVRRLGPYAYERHTIVHHGYFTHDAMAIRSGRDVCWALFPPWAYLGVLGSVAPAVVAVYFFSGSTNAAWLFFLAVQLYYLMYELVHTCAHLPQHLWITQVWPMPLLTEHHRIHHDPKLMSRYNFSFITPVFDLLFGTYYRPATAPRSQEATDERASLQRT